jgi:glycogen operon protein
MVFLNGDRIPEPNRRGEPVIDDSFLLLLNAHDDDLTFTLPGSEYGAAWTAVLDTDGTIAAGVSVDACTELTVTARSVIVLTRPPTRQ